MSASLGNQIMTLRKSRGMTQEQLANELGISYQAVSKWENEISCPDISTLPLLADLFGVSLDELFGREVPKAAEPDAEETPQPAGSELPWEDDETLHAVLFCGRRMISHDENACRKFAVRRQIQFQYEGPALNIQSDFSVRVVGDVQGNVSAGEAVNCDTVQGDVNAGGDVSCDTVQGNVSAGGDVSCDNVGGSVSAGGDVSCDRVNGDAQAGGDLNCDETDGKGFSFRIKL